MTSTRFRNAWICLAVAAMAVTCVARAQAGIQSATAYAHPVLQFLAGHPAAEANDANGLPRRPNHSARSHYASGTWQAVTPILFIGLVAPLSLLSPHATLCLGHTPAAPALPCSFQRPPPSLRS